MKTVFNTCFLLGFLISISGTLSAQHSKCDSNTCTTKRSGTYRVELAGCDNFLDLYVLDASGSPLKNVPIKGDAEFFYLDETSLMVSLKQFFKTNSLRAKVPCSGFYNCRVILTIDTEICEVYFDNECDLRAQLK
jgi:hypothetical protein